MIENRIEEFSQAVEILMACFSAIIEEGANTTFAEGWAEMPILMVEVRLKHG